MFLSPMARITDAAFRSLCKKYGAGMTVTELINAKGLLQHPERVAKHCQKAENENHFAVQLFGAEPGDMARAAKLVEPYCDFIDINLGCPAYKICRVGAGSELLRNPEQIGRLVEKMGDAVNIPITVKTRTGINDDLITIQKVREVVEDAGAALLSIHGRTRDQGYSGEANWDIIRQVKEQAQIPIVGNGDITSPESAQQKLNASGVDYASIGRAASGNPYLFKQINDYLQTGSYKELSISERLQIFQEYLELSKEFETKFLLQKIQAQHFTRGLVGGAVIREHISRAKSTEELFSAVNKCIEMQDESRS